MSTEPKIKVSYGPNELEISSGTATSVAALRVQVEELLNIPSGAKVTIDGKAVEPSEEKTTKIPKDAKEVTFIKETGNKA